MYTADESGIVERFPDMFLAAFPIAIETQPMLHFHPGGKFLQVCTAGCNLHCEGCASEILVDHAESLARSDQAVMWPDGDWPFSSSLEPAAQSRSGTPI